MYGQDTTSCSTSTHLPLLLRQGVKCPTSSSPATSTTRWPGARSACVDYVEELGRKAGAGDGRAAIEAGFAAITEQEDALMPSGCWISSTAAIRCRIIGRRSSAIADRVADRRFRFEGQEFRRGRRGRGRAQDRHPPRRFLRLPAGRGSRPDRRRAASCASRWCTTTRWTRSTASSPPLEPKL